MAMKMRRQRRHRREKQTFDYECSISGERYTLTARAPQPKELLSISAFYELNPDKDDRPAVVKKKLGLEVSENQ